MARPRTAPVRRVLAEHDPCNSAVLPRNRSSTSLPSAGEWLALRIGLEQNTHYRRGSQILEERPGEGSAVGCRQPSGARSTVTGGGHLGFAGSPQEVRRDAAESGTEVHARAIPE